MKQYEVKFPSGESYTIIGEKKVVSEKGVIRILDIDDEEIATIPRHATVEEIEWPTND